MSFEALLYSCSYLGMDLGNKIIQPFRLQTKIEFFLNRFFLSIVENSCQMNLNRLNVKNFVKLERKWSYIFG